MGASKSVCDLCTLNPVRGQTQRDFRNHGEPLVGTYSVCGKCSRLNNFWFLRLMKAPDKRKVLGELMEGDWTDWAVKKKKPK